MNLKYFIRGKTLYIVSQVLLITVMVTFLSLLDSGLYTMLFVATLIIIVSASTITIEYIQKNNFYKEIYENLNLMDKKYLLSAVIDEKYFYEDQNFIEGYILCDVLRQTSKAMNDEIVKYKISSDEYREYIETWIHEIKTPIASINLICENNKNDVIKSISEEMSKVDYFIEQSLYYAKSTDLEKDYIVKEVELDRLVKESVKQFSRQLISNKAQINIEASDVSVMVDEKWFKFILSQIINNSIKYKSNDDLKLDFIIIENEHQVLLNIIDNGIGICKKDIRKVFQKGFTGENGRKYSKSTGIGLYLSKKLCDKMHLSIRLLERDENTSGTNVEIVFPKQKNKLK